MNETYFPMIQEIYRTAGVSIEADNLRLTSECSQISFLSNSVFVQELYKDSINRKFTELKSIWENETMWFSDVSEITNNSAYREIIDLGEDVLPFIFEDLDTNNNHWFYALNSITGSDPISTNHKGIFPQMKNDWLNWASENHYINEF